MTSTKNVLIWDYALDGLVFEDKANGIAVQFYFWSLTFIEHGWGVYSLSTKKRPNKQKISFIKLGKSKFDFFIEWIKVVYVIRRTNSNLIIVRGADRKTFPVALVSKLLKVKFVFFAASDVNFVPGKELIHGVELNKKLYQKSIRLIPYIVVQNTYQKQTLLNNYGKSCLMMPNIWRGETNNTTTEKHIDVIWIANFRRLKRAEWMVNIARKNKKIRFVLVGRPSAEKEYYNEIEHDCSELDNVTFYGPLGLDETNALVARSRILACTSEFEGFPNTFLQAWANSIPVVSTVDPSNVIEQNNLGIIVNNEDEFNISIQNLLADRDVYENKCNCIKKYFKAKHSSDANFSKLMTYIQE